MPKFVKQSGQANQVTTDEQARLRLREEAFLALTQMKKSAEKRPHSAISLPSLEASFERLDAFKEKRARSTPVLRGQANPVSELQSEFERLKQQELSLVRELNEFMVAGKKSLDAVEGEIARNVGVANEVAGKTNDLAQAIVRHNLERPAEFVEPTATSSNSGLNQPARPAAFELDRVTSQLKQAEDRQLKLLNEMKAQTVNLKQNTVRLEIDNAELRQQYEETLKTLSAEDQRAFETFQQGAAQLPVSAAFVCDVGATKKQLGERFRFFSSRKTEEAAASGKLEQVQQRLTEQRAQIASIHTLLETHVSRVEAHNAQLAAQLSHSKQ